MCISALIFNFIGVSQPGQLQITPKIIIIIKEGCFSISNVVSVHNFILALPGTFNRASFPEMTSITDKRIQKRPITKYMMI